MMGSEQNNNPDVIHTNEHDGAQIFSKLLLKACGAAIAISMLCSLCSIVTITGQQVHGLTQPGECTQRLDTVNVDLVRGATTPDTIPPDVVYEKHSGSGSYTLSTNDATKSIPFVTLNDCRFTYNPQTGEWRSFVLNQLVTGTVGSPSLTTPSSIGCTIEESSIYSGPYVVCGTYSEGDLFMRNPIIVE